VAKKRQVDEFQQSLLQPVRTDASFRRVVATAKDADDYNRRYRPPLGTTDQMVKFCYGTLSERGLPPLKIAVSICALLKMHGWVAARSEDFSLEVQGRFLAKRRADGLIIDDFVPLPSFCQSLAYETEDATDRMERFGSARMRTISVDDWKPQQTQFYEDLGIFADADRIPVDPYKVPIPFHSHYLRSAYQDGPSPGDFDGVYHLKWLYAPGSGKNILYSGVIQLQQDVPYLFPPLG
jgi:hypothetical protein